MRIARGSLRRLLKLRTHGFALLIPSLSFVMSFIGWLLLILIVLLIVTGAFGGDRLTQGSPYVWSFSSVRPLLDSTSADTQVVTFPDLMGGTSRWNMELYVQRLVSNKTTTCNDTDSVNVRIEILGYGAVNNNIPLYTDRMLLLDYDTIQYGGTKHWHGDTMARRIGILKMMIDSLKYDKVKTSVDSTGGTATDHYEILPPLIQAIRFRISTAPGNLSSIVKMQLVVQPGSVDAPGLPVYYKVK